MESVYLPQNWVSPPTPIPFVVCPAQIPFLGALEKLDGTHRISAGPLSPGARSTWTERGPSVGVGGEARS